MMLKRNLLEALGLKEFIPAIEDELGSDFLDELIEPEEIEDPDWATKSSKVRQKPSPIDSFIKDFWADECMKIMENNVIWCQIAGRNLRDER